MKSYTLKPQAHSQNPPQFKIRYDAELNPAQLEVVMTLDGPLLVIAGAGSGKTRTLVYRVARLMETGIPPQNILLLTFTRKAAQEMLRRVGLLLQMNCDRVAGGTFHSIANSILRQYGKAVGIDPAFTILDRSDGEDIIQMLRATHGYNEKEKRFPHKNTLAEIFSQSSNKMTDLDEVVFEDYVHFAHHLDAIRELEKLYTHYKRQRMLLDYDDLMLRLLELLETQADIRRRLSETYRYIMVDEYQDTNKIQSRIVRLLSDSHDNVMVVGDDAQSIYSFRGANFRNIMDFPSEFRGTRVFRLEENYRSTQPILDLTNEIIAHAKEKYPKHLFSRISDGERPGLVRADNENFQSRFISQKVQELREEGIPLSEMAVLFRSSYHSFDLEIELSRNDIPFVKRGGFKFVETAHVKDVLAHLRVLANPLDAVSWNRLLLLLDGVGPKKAREIISAIGSGDTPVRALKGQSERYGKEARQRLSALAEMMEEIGSDTGGASNQIQSVCRYYFPILQKKYDDYPKRMKDLEHLLTITERYFRLSDFLADMALESPEEAGSGGEGAHGETEKLVLSTIHSAKGLEWHAVFIIWLLDGRFPSAYSFDSDEDLEEERRLLYVAATRAKRTLYMIYPTNIYDRALGVVLSRPARFLDEIPKERYENWSLTE
jgi:DNA helicase-2/ATP-dependent DNA helicase PcrA